MTGLVGDIGGTNARFALATADAQGVPRLDAIKTYRCADFITIDDAIEAYLAEVGARPDLATIAVASPVHVDVIKMTNHVWRFSITEVRRKLAMPGLQFINDFMAVSLSVLAIGPNQRARIGKPELNGQAQSKSVAVLGPGTGLGMGGLIRSDGQTVVLDSEGGHMSFAPVDETEVEIARVLLRRYPRLSNERVVSGEGLRNLYVALAEVYGLTAEDLRPADITARALAREDVLCHNTLERFCAILGSVAGDAALMVGAQSVFIGGGIVPRFVEFVQNSHFRQRFEAKGRFHDWMARVPTLVILEQHAGLLGAAVHQARGCASEGKGP